MRGEQIEMSGRKNSFGQAMFEMFGVGRDQSSEGSAAGGERQLPEEPQLPREETPGAAEEAAGLFPAGAGPVPLDSPAALEEFRHAALSPTDGFRQVQTAVPVHTCQGTYLAAGTVTRGSLTARGDVEIAGDFEGEITAKGKVTLHSNATSRITASGLALVGCSLTGDSEISGDVSVDEQSAVTGNVKAENLVCSGKITGDLDIQDNLVLSELAHVEGNIKADTMSIARGAKINGKIEMRNINNNYK